MEKTKIFLVCPMMDGQSGKFIYDSFTTELNCKVAYFDWRVIGENNGIKVMNEKLLDAIEQLKPDLTIIIKGLGIKGETIRKIREIHEHKIVGWIFDNTIGEYELENLKPYIDFIKELDIFYSVTENHVDKLTPLGVNCKFLMQACFPPMHNETIMNSIQQRKYGSELVFLGTIDKLHKNRNKFLDRLDKEGFDFKIYGEVLYENGSEPDFVKKHHTGFAAVDDMFANACGASKIVIDINGWPERKYSWSLRLYKVLCAGGFLLTTHSNGIEDYFKPGIHLETYKSEDEMVEKIIKYLNDNEARKRIAKAGQEEVLKNHLQVQRLQQILEDVELNRKI